ncbi:PT domain-containing protein [Streptomyces sp. S.PB5]|uniref:PT domain-containing protein n=1 Tax=Streptomyces sp. S.PB5 TaxID=3020844 RepID=UPI0025AFC903|nr:PT domain-containing protein [Streptomyces sp. S.PB5]MDN3020769.1 PT domain-containing protein [Streptomyces sp. S.PB5]
MNTERPENDDDAEVGKATGADEGAGDAEERDGTAAEAEAAEETGATETGATETATTETEAAGEAAESEAAEEAEVAAAESAEAPARARAVEEVREEAEAGPEEGGGDPHEPLVAASVAESADGGRRVRRRSPALIASVAAAVLLVGGGGAYFATSASGGSGGETTSGANGDDTPPLLHLDGYTGNGGGTVGIAPGEPDPNGVTYQADGTLPDGPGEAPVYRATGEVTEDEVARLAKALGIDGTPVLEGKAWKVGGQEAAGPSLQVNQLAPGAWTFHRYAPGTDNCQSETVCASDPVAPAGDPVSEKAATEAAAPVLKAVGQDDAKIDASQVMGAQRVVNADPVVGGLPTHGWTTGVTVSAQGEVVGGSGQLKAPVKSDTYPVVDAEQALALLNAKPAADHRMGIGGCASPVPLKDRLEAPCGSSGAASPSAGAPARDTITVEKAVFGLASHYVDARQALVPSWLFEVRASGAQDGFTVTYPAIDPKYLAPATQPTEPGGPSDEPTGQPSPRPTGPDPDQPTAAPATRDVTVEGYTAEGSELTVSYTGGVCADYKVSVEQGADEVKVTVTETPWEGKICIMIAKTYHETLQLDEPLGDREVVGSDGKQVPLQKAGARLPETSGAR